MNEVERARREDFGRHPHLHQSPTASGSGGADEPPKLRLTLTFTGCGGLLVALLLFALLAFLGWHEFERWQEPTRCPQIGAPRPA